MQSHFLYFCSQFGTEYGIATRTNRYYRGINPSVTGARRVDPKTGPSPAGVMMSFQKSSHNNEAFKISGIVLKLFKFAFASAVFHEHCGVYIYTAF